MCRPITPPSPALPPINIVRGVLPRGKWLPLPSRGSPGSSLAPPSLKIVPGDDRAWEMASPPITWLPWLIPAPLSRKIIRDHVALLPFPALLPPKSSGITWLSSQSQRSFPQNRPGSRGSPGSSQRLSPSISSHPRRLSPTKSSRRITERGKRSPPALGCRDHTGLSSRPQIPHAVME